MQAEFFPNRAKCGQTRPIWPNLGRRSSTWGRDRSKSNNSQKRPNVCEIKQHRLSWLRIDQVGAGATSANFAHTQVGSDHSANITPAATKLGLFEISPKLALFEPTLVRFRPIGATQGGRTMIILER